MKKIFVIMMALVMALSMTSVAFAATGSVSYNAASETVSWEVSGVEGFLSVILEGNTIGTSAPNGKADISGLDLEPGTYTVYFKDLGGSNPAGTITIPGAEPVVTATPTPDVTNTPEPTEEPTATPTPDVTNTPEPSEEPTEEPTEKPTAKPTKKPVVEDDDVPKTGDTASYAVVIAAMALAAAYLVSRRFGRAN